MHVAIPIIKKLILEIEEAFNTTGLPIIDAFHAFDLRNIPTGLTSGYGEKEIYDFYGSNKINIFQRQRNEAMAIIDQAVHCSCLMSNKKVLDKSTITKNVAATENKLQEQEKKKRCTAKIIKKLKENPNFHGILN